MSGMRNPAHLLTYPAWDVSLHDSGDHCYESSRCVLDALPCAYSARPDCRNFLHREFDPVYTGNGRGHLKPSEAFGAFMRRQLRSKLWI